MNISWRRVEVKEEEEEEGRKGRGREEEGEGTCQIISSKMGRGQHAHLEGWR
jgi:hypothetical protein